MSDEKRSRAPLLEGEKFYRQLVENSQGLICAHNLSGQLLYASPASAAELGYGGQDLAGWNLRELLAPSVQHHFDAYLDRIGRKGTDQGLLRLRRKDGEERLWAYRNVLCLESGRPAYVIGHAVDITDRVGAEELLRESEERGRAVVAALHEGIIFRTADGTISGCNRSAEQILGTTVENLRELTDGNASCPVIQDDGSPFPSEAHPTAITLRTGRPCSGVVMGVARPDGELVWIEINSEPMLKPGEARPYGVVASFTDITERRRRRKAQERDLREALAKIKILHGILSICSSCKKVRDDQGDWQQVEIYVRDHSEADFSHGLCPDCEDRLYPDLPPERA